MPRDTSPVPADDANDLDAFVAERTEKNPEFPALVRAAARRRELFGTMARIRKAEKVSQKVVGRTANTSQAAIARLERGDADCRFSTAERYAAALGYEIVYDLVPVVEDSALASGKALKGRVEARAKRETPETA